MTVAETLWKADIKGSHLLADFSSVFPPFTHREDQGGSRRNSQILIWLRSKQYQYHLQTHVFHLPYETDLRETSMSAGLKWNLGSLLQRVDLGSLDEKQEF